MKEIKIHQRYYKGSHLCPICNEAFGKIPRNGYKLCYYCNKDIEDNNIDFAKIIESYEKSENFSRINQTQLLQKKHNKNAFILSVLLLIPFISIMVYLIYLDEAANNGNRIEQNSTYANLKKTDALNTANRKNYYIGEKGPGGGYIFFDRGSNTKGWRYLEAAPADIKIKARWYRNRLSRYITLHTAIGTGKENTRKIIISYGSGNYAAKLCVNYSNNGKRDWFLPSKEELVQMHKHLRPFSSYGFKLNGYWSSSEDNTEGIPGIVWYQMFWEPQEFCGVEDGRMKLNVRPIRAF